MKFITRFLSHDSTLEAASGAGAALALVGAIPTPAAPYLLAAGSALTTIAHSAYTAKSLYERNDPSYKGTNYPYNYALSNGIIAAGSAIAAPSTLVANQAVGFGIGVGGSVIAGVGSMMAGIFSSQFGKANEDHATHQQGTAYKASGAAYWVGTVATVLGRVAKAAGKASASALSTVSPWLSGTASFISMASSAYVIHQQSKTPQEEATAGDAALQRLEEGRSEPASTPRIITPPPPVTIELQKVVDTLRPMATQEIKPAETHVARLSRSDSPSRSR